MKTHKQTDFQCFFSRRSLLDFSELHSRDGGIESIDLSSSRRGVGLVGGSNDVFARSRLEEMNGGGGLHAQRTDADARMVLMMQEVGLVWLEKGFG